MYVSKDDDISLTGIICVYLDGEDVTEKCTNANSDAGWVRMYVKDRDGRFILKENGERMTKTIAGRVEIKRNPKVEVSWK